jgi:hypothetical protein
MQKCELPMQLLGPVALWPFAPSHINQPGDSRRPPADGHVLPVGRESGVGHFGFLRKQLFPFVDGLDLDTGVRRFLNFGAYVQIRSRQ